MRTNYSTLLGLSLWLILIGGVIVYGAYNGSLNDSNANIVIGVLFLAGDVIGWIAAIRYFRRGGKQTSAASGRWLNSH